MELMAILIIFHLTFFGSNVFHHWVYYVLSLLKLAYGKETSSVTLGVVLTCDTALKSCLFLTILSCIFIVASILRIPSAEGKHKSSISCVSHLTVIILNYDSVSIIHLKSKGLQSMDSNPLMATTYTAFASFLSLIIFSLKNKEIKNGIRGSFQRKFSSLSS